MSNNKKNENKQIWMYAVILFTGAFIILLLTAYSQEKFQNNVSDMQNKLDSEKSSKITAMTDLNSAIKENKILTEELDSMRKKLIDSEQKLAEEEQKNKDQQVEIDNTSSTYNLLLIAQEYYNKDDIVNCAITLRYEIDTNNLTQKGAQFYNDLVAKTYSDASRKLYNDGVTKYRKKEFKEAIISFNRSIDLSQGDTYLENCHYYIAKCYYRDNSYEEAIKSINDFLKIYPNSKYGGELKSILDKIS